MKKSALILGGNRFFGRHLALALLAEDYEVTLLNRGRMDDRLGSQVERFQADRRNEAELQKSLSGKNFDLVFDQICFSATDATSLCEMLKGRAKKVVFTSSQSVYGTGLEISRAKPGDGANALSDWS
jgi:nucleoside-diphosphate-sugar epimerase